MENRDVRQFSEVDDLLAVVHFGSEKCVGFAKTLQGVEVGLAHCREKLNCSMLIRQLQSLQASLGSTCQALQEWELKALAHLHQLHQLVHHTEDSIAQNLSLDYQGLEQKITYLLKMLKSQHQLLLDKKKRSERLYVTIVARQRRFLG